jgi:hypothetical protein
LIPVIRSNAEITVKPACKRRVQRKRGSIILRKMNILRFSGETKNQQQREYLFQMH